MKKTLLNILFGASLILGTGNKTNAQECECVKYNHDADEFPEEVICWKTKEPDKKNDIKRYTILNYSDKDNDNFYESIRVFNCDKTHKSGGGAAIVIFNIEDFYIDKHNRNIDYNWKRCHTLKKKYLENYSNKQIADIAKENSPEKFFCQNVYSGQNLTIEQIYSLFPGFWNFYGGFGERTKKLINAGKDEIELKNLISNERYVWGSTYK